MADTCSISFNRQRDDGTVEISKLWSDLKEKFKGDRKSAVAHYLLTENEEFLEMNGIGRLLLDENGEITMPSLLRALGENEGEEESVARNNLNSAYSKVEFTYLDALDNAIKFNRSQYYLRAGRKPFGGKPYRGLMATIDKRSNGKYVVVIVERSGAEEARFAKHIENRILTQALEKILRQNDLYVKFNEDSLAKMRFDSSTMPENMATHLKQIAAVIQGEETSVEVAEVVGHFLVTAMRGNPLVERLINMFSATEEDVKQGKTKEGKSYAKLLKKGEISVTDDSNRKEGAVMTGEQMQQLIIKDGNPDNNPFYKEDFDVSIDNAVEAAGIVLGRQLIAPMLSSELDPVKSWAGKAGAGIIKLIRRLGKYITRKLRHVNGQFVDNMIKDAKQRADAVVAEYLGSADLRGSLLEDFERNTRFYEDGGRTIIRKAGIERLSENAQKCALAYTDTVSELKAMAGELNSLLARAEQRPENRKTLKAVKDILKEVLTKDPNINLELFSELASRDGIALALYKLTDVLSGPVADLVEQISSNSKVEDMQKTVKDYASMRSIIAIYVQAASILNNLKAASVELKVNQPVTIEGVSTTFTLKEVMNALEHKLTNEEDGLAKTINEQMKRMAVQWAEKFYGQDYIDYGVRVLWPWEASAKVRLKTQGKFRLSRDTGGKIDLNQFAESLEQDINWMDEWLFAASDCSDVFVQVADEAVRNANMLADRLAADFWYRLESLRIHMKDLFGTDDCRIFYEQIEELDEHGDGTGKMHLTGNLISVGLSDQEKDKDGVLYGQWEAERSAFEDQLKRDFRNYLEQLKLEFYELKDDIGRYVNKQSVYYLSDTARAALYHDFIKDKWKQWHQEHSVKSKSGSNKGAWIPNSAKYKNPQFDELFPDTEIGKARLRWYRQLLSIKAEMDAMLPPGATVNVRAPQILGELRHRYHNLKNAGEEKSFRRAVLRRIGDRVHIRPDEAYLFGTNNEFNDIGQDPFEHQVFFEKDKRERLAFWGVNRLPDMSDLSTDLFSTLEDYNGMVCTYQAMSSVVDIAELGKEILAKREVKTKGKRGSLIKKGKESRAYKRYVKFLEKQVYGLNVTPPKFHIGRIALKIAQQIARAGTQFMLEYNIPGGSVNAGTGFIEVFKEAMAGENFTVGELKRAMKFYFKYIFGNWKQKGGHQAKTDKISLLIRHFNILGDNKLFFKEQHYDKGAIAEKFGKFGIGRNWKSWINGWGMSVYTMGEHFMQTFPYLAMMEHDKYFIEVDDGFGGKKLKEVDMLDLYDFQHELKDGYKENDSNENAVVDRCVLKKGQIAFLSSLDWKDYKLILEVLDNIDRLKGSSNFRSQSEVKLGLSSRELKRLSELGVIIPGWSPSSEEITTRYAKLRQFEDALKEQQKRHTFNETTEVLFMTKARNATDHLHGLYATESKNKFQLYWYGALLAGMRGYMFGMITHRYGRNRYSLAQKKNVEGHLWTAAKTYYGVVSDWDNKDNWYGSFLGASMSGALTGSVAQALSLISPTWGIIMASLNLAKGIPMWIWGRERKVKLRDSKGKPILDEFGNPRYQYVSRVDEAMRTAGYSENQYRNIRRCAMSYMIISALTLLRALFSTKFADDDDDPYIADTSSPTMGMIYYFTSRLLREQAAFNTPLGVFDEMKQFDFYLPIGVSGGFDLATMATMKTLEGFDQIDGEKDWDWLYYKSDKENQYAAWDSKASVRFKRRTIYGDLLYMWNWMMYDETLYPGRTTNVIFNGYEAATAFDYNRRNR